MSVIASRGKPGRSEERSSWFLLVTVFSPPSRCHHPPSALLAKPSACFLKNWSLFTWRGGLLTLEAVLPPSLQVSTHLGLQFQLTLRNGPLYKLLFVVALPVFRVQATAKHPRDSLTGTYDYSD